MRMLYSCMSSQAQDFSNFLEGLGWVMTLEVEVGLVEELGMAVNSSVELVSLKGCLVVVPIGSTW